MSNVSNLILNLQEKLKTVDNALELATLAKAIEKLKVRAVNVVDNFASLPTGAENGSVYLVKSEEELYYKVGTTWFSLGNITGEFVFSTGRNSNGQLGIGTTIDTSLPTVVSSSLNWSKISAGEQHCSGIINGIGYAWGNGTLGKLGTGISNDNRSTPTLIVGGITNWQKISSGGLVTLGLTTTGVGYVWGWNIEGQLGNSGSVFLSRSTPDIIDASIINWSDISVGPAINSRHCLGIADGVAYAWGNNSSGQLGDGTTIGRSSPVTVVGGITNWSQVSAGGTHSLAIANGIAYGWGAQVRLGDGTGFARSSPVTVVGGITNWTQVSGGQYHSLGVTADGIAYGWGYNNVGRVGDGTTVNRSSPVTVIGGITNWSQIDAGGNHSLGLTSNGNVYAWGNNNSGQIGDGTATPKSSPLIITGGASTWSAISAGNEHSIFIAPGLIKTYVQ